MSVSTKPSICPSDNDSMKGRTRSNSINITSWEHNMEDRNLPVSVASVHPREQITQSLHPLLSSHNNNNTTHDTTRPTTHITTHNTQHPTPNTQHTIGRHRYLISHCASLTVTKYRHSATRRPCRKHVLATVHIHMHIHQRVGNLRRLICVITLTFGE